MDCCEGRWREWREERWKGLTRGSDGGIDERFGERIDGSVRKETMMEHTDSQVDSRGRCEGEGKYCV